MQMSKHRDKIAEKAYILDIKNRVALTCNYCSECSPVQTHIETGPAQASCGEDISSSQNVEMEVSLHSVCDTALLTKNHVPRGTISPPFLLSCLSRHGG